MIFFYQFYTTFTFVIILIIFSLSLNILTVFHWNTESADLISFYPPYLWKVSSLQLNLYFLIFSFISKCRCYNLLNYFTIFWENPLFSYTSNIAIIFSSVERPSTVGFFSTWLPIFRFPTRKTWSQNSDFHLHTAFGRFVLLTVKMIVWNLVKISLSIRTK